MKDFEGFFTLDGSVGLYSENDNDVYHSVYGALTEAYEKFINPSDLKAYFENNNEIKILDICYGIGYNTKAFINYFLENILQKKSKNKCTLTESIEPIHTDNILGKNSKDNKEIFSLKGKYINTLYTYNISKVLVRKMRMFFEKKNCLTQKTNLPNWQIYIHAIDTNLTLIKLSPFIKSINKKNLFKYIKQSKTGIEKIDRYLLKNKNNYLKNNIKYNLLDETNMLIVIKLVDVYKDKIFSDDVIKILSDKKLSLFFDEKMLNFASFYLKRRYNLSSKWNKLTFLHNIYYQYLSKSYKNTLKVLENNNFILKVSNEDARKTCCYDDSTYDCIFLDAFTPAKSPSLWTEDFFKVLYEHLNHSGKLLTYSKSAIVRNAMIKNKFYLGNTYDDNENIIGTIATKEQSLIKHNLTKYELGLINTKAGITYKDSGLNLSISEILDNRNKEVETSELQSSTQYIKNYKGDKDEI